MIPDENLFNHAAESLNLEQEHRRMQTLQDLGLLESEFIPIFEEATQTAAHFLHAPICVLGILDADRVVFKSAVGLSRIGLMNTLAASRQLPRSEAFCTRVVDQQRVLMIADASTDPTTAHSLLVQRYGIQSYLGVPLFAANGQCMGSLAVMDMSPHTFSDQEVAFLELIARWSMSEFERNCLQQKNQQLAVSEPIPSGNASSIKATLLSQMSQELCTPLTSILGMAKVLNQGIYGALSDKQREYIQVIHNSGQYLLSLVNELVDLGALDDQSSSLNLSSIDIEMLCQQAISALNQAAQRREQQIQLTVEPGNRIWLLDKEKVRQMLYHLTFSIIQASNAGSIIRIHVSRKQGMLNLAVWASHPWLGEGLPQAIVATQPIQPLSLTGCDWDDQSTFYDTEDWVGSQTTAKTTGSKSNDSRQSLGLLLSRQLAHLHAGEIIVQGSTEEGRRYVIRLPQVKSGDEQPVAARSGSQNSLQS